jgi:hypothetical protein
MYRRQKPRHLFVTIAVTATIIIPIHVTAVIFHTRRRITSDT